MTRRPVDVGVPERLYTVTGGRSRAVDDSFDLVTLIVAECAPSAGMPSEHIRILRLCRTPTAVVELSADLGMPVTVVRILLGDLLATGRVTARHPPPPAGGSFPLPDSALLKEVLVGLRNL
ncbi:DUF742 domain-containing protein [Streptomyces genisteinicus]|uniref:DUF742 domain-containing protein n=1 Tax=Streptomyces genisteinicus TaxID=2768068 RepID=A0A7H0HNQ5_9ACTN|nr:DUF742 domain-containing protein [Streptomyces genisteinicus]QNP62171.1 DUF742 domain-containing protein [Streptomyces genisteinicus]